MLASLPHQTPSYNTLRNPIILNKQLKLLLNPNMTTVSTSPNELSIEWKNGYKTTILLKGNPRHKRLEHPNMGTNSVNQPRRSRSSTSNKKRTRDNVHNYKVGTIFLARNTHHSGSTLKAISHRLRSQGAHKNELEGYRRNTILKKLKTSQIKLDLTFKNLKNRGILDVRSKKSKTEKIEAKIDILISIMKDISQSNGEMDTRIAILEQKIAKAVTFVQKYDTINNEVQLVTETIEDWKETKERIRTQFRRIEETFLKVGEDNLEINRIIAIHSKDNETSLKETSNIRRILNEMGIYTLEPGDEDYKEDTKHPVKLNETITKLHKIRELLMDGEKKPRRKKDTD